MSDLPSAKPPSKGKVWVKLRVNQPIGVPLAEWAYVTPRHPQGIKASALRSTSADQQRDTALFWFLANLKPYDLSDGGPWFGFGEAGGSIGSAPIGSAPIGAGIPIAGFGQGRYAPSPVNAFDALQQEFGGVLSDDLIHTLGQNLGSNWMRITDPPLRTRGGITAPTLPFARSHDRSAGRHGGRWHSTGNVVSDSKVGALNSPRILTTDEPSSREELRSSIMQAMDDLRRQVQQLAPNYGQIGHNGGPPGDFPITPEEQASAIEAIEDTKNAVAAVEVDPARVKIAWSRVTKVVARLGAWALDQANTFITGFASEGGKSLGQQLPRLIVLAISIWFGLGTASTLIEKYLGG